MTTPAAQRVGRDSDTTTSPDVPVLQVRDLAKHFRVKASGLGTGHTTVKAVDGISFDVSAGETLGLVGESGCGKSTAAFTIVRLDSPTRGTIQLNGRDITSLKGADLRSVRREIQIVFQDPYASLNPRATVEEIVGEPLRVHGFDRKSRRRRVDELLENVGLSSDHRSRYPHEFSGGQRQRIGIARALALKPTVLVLDEPVSALDVSVQAQIINLLAELQKEYGLGYLLISHDLSVVRHIADRLAVMYLGRIVEVGTKEQIFDGPVHPYTQALLSAVPTPTPRQRDARRRIILRGELPDPGHRPVGCVFAPRCWKRQDLCEKGQPELDDRQAHGHESACLFPDLRRPTGSKSEAAGGA